MYGFIDFNYVLMVVIPGLVLSYWSAITYVPTMRHALAEGRKERIT